MNNIILFCHPRSGSSRITTLFQTQYLNSRPYNGPYYPEFIKYALLPDESENARQSLINPNFKKWQDYYKFNPTEFSKLDFSARKIIIKNIVHQMLSTETHIVLKYFKSMTDVISINEMIELKNLYNLKFVSLVRKDLLKSAISYLAARQTNIWNKIYPYAESRSLHLTITDEEKTNFLYNLDQQIINWTTTIKEYSNYMDIHLNYENDVATDNFCSILGLQSVPTTVKLLTDNDFNLIISENPWIIDEVRSLNYN